MGNKKFNFFKAQIEYVNVSRLMYHEQLGTL